MIDDARRAVDAKWLPPGARIWKRTFTVQAERVICAGLCLHYTGGPPSSSGLLHFTGLAAEVKLYAFGVWRPNLEVAHGSLVRSATGKRFNNTRASSFPPSTVSPVN